VAQPPTVPAARPERRSRADRKGRLGPHDPRPAADAGKSGAGKSEPGKADTGRSESAKGRPSVPSWDDILFGVRRQQ
jgi:hypothetical protein